MDSTPCSPIHDDKLMAYIYDDVEECDIFAFKEPIGGQEASKSDSRDISCVLAENEELKSKISALEGEKNLLELRISEMYKTARAELERKDKRLQQLSEEINNIVFRRKKFRFNGTNNPLPQDNITQDYHTKLQINETKVKTSAENPKNTDVLMLSDDDHDFVLTVHGTSSNLASNNPRESTTTRIKSRRELSPRTPPGTPPEPIKKSDHSSLNMRDKNLILKERATQKDHERHCDESRSKDKKERLCDKTEESKKNCSSQNDKIGVLASKSEGELSSSGRYCANLSLKRSTDIKNTIIEVVDNDIVDKADPKPFDLRNKIHNKTNKDINTNKPGKGRIDVDANHPKSERSRSRAHIDDNHPKSERSRIVVSSEINHKQDHSCKNKSTSHRSRSNSEYKIRPPRTPSGSPPRDSDRRSRSPSRERMRRYKTSASSPARDRRRSRRSRSISPFKRHRSVRYRSREHLSRNRRSPVRRLDKEGNSRRSSKSRDRRQAETESKSNETRDKHGNVVPSTYSEWKKSRMLQQKAERSEFKEDKKEVVINIEACDEIDLWEVKEDCSDDEIALQLSDVSSEEESFETKEHKEDNFEENKIDDITNGPSLKINLNKMSEEDLKRILEEKLEELNKADLEASESPPDTPKFRQNWECSKYICTGNELNGFKTLFDARQHERRKNMENTTQEKCAINQSSGSNVKLKQETVELSTNKRICPIKETKDLEETLRPKDCAAAEDTHETAKIISKKKIDLEAYKKRNNAKEDPASVSTNDKLKEIMNDKIKKTNEEIQIKRTELNDNANDQIPIVDNEILNTELSVKFKTDDRAGSSEIVSVSSRKESSSFLHDFSMSEDDDEPTDLKRKENEANMKITVLDVVIVQPAGSPKPAVVAAENPASSTMPTNDSENVESIENIQDAVYSNVPQHENFVVDGLEKLNTEDLQKCLEEDIPDSPTAGQEANGTVAPKRSLGAKYMKLFGSDSPANADALPSTTSESRKAKVKKVKKNLNDFPSNDKTKLSDGAKGKAQPVKPKQRKSRSKTADEVLSANSCKNTPTDAVADTKEKGSKSCRDGENYPIFCNNPNYIPNVLDLDSRIKLDEFIKHKVDTSKEEMLVVDTEESLGVTSDEICSKENMKNKRRKKTKTTGFKVKMSFNNQKKGFKKKEIPTPSPRRNKTKADKKEKLAETPLTESQALITKGETGRSPSTTAIITEAIKVEKRRLNRKKSPKPKVKAKPNPTTSASSPKKKKTKTESTPPCKEKTHNNKNNKLPVVVAQPTSTVEDAPKTSRRITPVKIGEVTSESAANKRKLNNSNKDERPEKIAKISESEQFGISSQSPLPHIEEMLKRFETKTSTTHVYTKSQGAGVGTGSFQRKPSDLSEANAVDLSFTDNNTVNQINLDSKDVSMLGALEKVFLDNLSEYLGDKSLPSFGSEEKTQSSENKRVSECATQVDFSRMLDKAVSTSTPMKMLKESTNVPQQATAPQGQSFDSFSSDNSTKVTKSYLKTPLKRDRRRPVTIRVMELPKKSPSL